MDDQGIEPWTTPSHVIGNFKLKSRIDAKGVLYH